MTTIIQGRQIKSDDARSRKIRATRAILGGAAAIATLALFHAAQPTAPPSPGTAGNVVFAGEPTDPGWNSDPGWDFQSS
jgi:hypothetical protein